MISAQGSAILQNVICWDLKTQLSWDRQSASSCFPLAMVLLSPFPSAHTSLGIWEVFKATEDAQGATRFCVSCREPCSQLPDRDVVVLAWVRMSDSVSTDHC